MLKHIYFYLAAVLLFSCSHTVDLRTSHFLTPLTGENQWSGSISFSGASPTKVTLVDNISANPPITDPVNINRDYSVSDIFAFSMIDFNFHISPYASLEFVVNNYTYGLKWQPINHGQRYNAWMASVLAAYGTKNTEHSTNSDKSESIVRTTRYGLSIGRAFEKALPYVSYIDEQHQAKVTVDNSAGRFGPYENKGRHQYLSVGVSTLGTGLKAAAEYNMINITWDDTKAYQNTFGVLLGYEW